jgi:hypothetical protein
MAAHGKAMKKIPRRKIWLGAFVATAALLLLAMFFPSNNIVVVLYNSSDQPFHQVTVSVGAQNRDAASLDSKESIVFSFPRGPASADVALFVDADPPLKWSAPSLANPGVARITLRVDDFGGVTVTSEESLWRRISHLLE